MPVQESDTSDTLKSQYAQRISSDLQKNTEEQERIRKEMVSLQESLSGLEKDHELLVGMQTALGGSAAVPGPRRTEKAAAKKTTGRAASAKKSSGPKPAAGATSGGEKQGPSIVKLSYQHLSEQSEPRTVGEIAEELIAAHPSRKINRNNVRTAMEGLVARSRAERSLQGSTVYYTAIKAGSSESTDTPSDEEQEPVPVDA